MKREMKPIIYLLLDEVNVVAGDHIQFRLQTDRAIPLLCGLKIVANSQISVCIRI